MCWHLGSRIVSLWSWDDKRTGHGCWDGKLSPGMLANGHKNLRVSKNINLVSVVQILDSIIHQINPYLLDSAISVPDTCPLDSDLSGVWCCPTFEQLGPDLEKWVHCSSSIICHSYLCHPPTHELQYVNVLLVNLSVMLASQFPWGSWDQMCQIFSLSPILTPSSCWLFSVLHLEGCNSRLFCSSPTFVSSINNPV